MVVVVGNKERKKERKVMKSQGRRDITKAGKGGMAWKWRGHREKES